MSKLTHNAPPLGVMPRFIHDEKRLYDVAGAIYRYLEVMQAIPLEWIEEYNELATRVIERQAKADA